MTALAGLQGSPQVLRHGMAEAPPVSGTVLALTGLGPSRVAEIGSVTSPKALAIRIARVARPRVGIVARKGQATRVLHTDLLTIFYRVEKLGSWFSSESGVVPGR